MNFLKDIVEELTTYFETIDTTIKIEELIPGLLPVPENYPEKFKTEQAEKKRLIRHQAINLLERFLNMKKRHVSCVRRQVFFSKALIQKIKENYLDLEFIEVINIIKTELESAIDVEPRLSKLVIRAKSNDLMLSDWGIYHFHLKNTKENPTQYFFDRSGPLLFAYIPQNKKEAYFIDIVKDHKDPLVFANQKLISIINQNWPSILGDYRLNDIEAEISLTDQQRLDLRQKGINVIDQINNNPIFNPGGGITSAGTSMSCNISTNQIIREVQEMEIICKNAQRNYVPQQIPEYINFKMKLHNDCLVVKQFPDDKVVYEIALKLHF